MESEMTARELESKIAGMMGWHEEDWDEDDLDDGGGRGWVDSKYWKHAKEYWHPLTDPAADLEVHQWIGKNSLITQIESYFKVLSKLLCGNERGKLEDLMFYRVGMYSKAAALTHGIIKSVEEIEG